MKFDTPAGASPLEHGAHGDVHRFLREGHGRHRVQIEAQAGQEHAHDRAHALLDGRHIGVGAGVVGDDVVIGCPERQQQHRGQDTGPVPAGRAVERDRPGGDGDDAEGGDQLRGGGFDHAGVHFPHGNVLDHERIAFRQPGTDALHEGQVVVGHGVSGEWSAAGDRGLVVRAQVDDRGEAAVDEPDCVFVGDDGKVVGAKCEAFAEEPSRDGDAAEVAQVDRGAEFDVEG